MNLKNLILLCFLFFFLQTFAQQYTVKSAYINQPDLNIEYVRKNADFWAKYAYDSIRGGFYSNIDRYGNIIPLTDVHTGVSYKRKSFIAQSRQAYGFTRAFMLTGDEKYLKYAKSALNFLFTYGWDTTNGGWYCFARENGTLDNGQWWDPNTGKWGFQQHYAMVGIVANYEATGNSTVKQWLDRSVTSLYTNMWDNRTGYEGYYSDATLNWGTKSGKGFTPTVDAITTNAELTYLTTGESQYKEKLLQLSDIIVDRLIPMMSDSRIKALYPENYSSDWVVDLSSTDGSIGHFLKTAWCLGRAYLCDTTKTEYKMAANAILDQSWNYQNGSVTIWDHTNGAPYNAINLTTGEWGTNGTYKDYWTIEQGFVGPMINYYISNNPIYLQMADESIDFFMKHQVDSVYGEIFSETNATGLTPLSTVKGDEFKASYHSNEFGYYAYLYSKLYYLHQDASLYYQFDTLAESRTIQFKPLPIQDTYLKIKSVLLNGEEFTNFDKDARTVTLQANQGGKLKVTYAYAGPNTELNVIEQNLMLTVYPNPAVDAIHLKSDKIFTTIRILDITGKEQTTYNTDQKTISVSHLKKGMYIIQAISEEGTTYLSKFVKL